MLAAVHARSAYVDGNYEHALITCDIREEFAIKRLIAFNVVGDYFILIERMSVIL